MSTLTIAHPLKDWFRYSLAYFNRPTQIIRHYQQDNLQADFIAGLTVGVVMLPQAIAFALIAELPAQVGLYTAIVGAIIGALWGSSAHLHTGPTNTTSLLVLSVLLTVAVPGTPEYLGAASLMAVMVGGIRLLMGLARLGVLVNFVSDSVIIGFTAGAGVLIFSNQLRHLLRLDIPSTPSFYVTLFEILNHIAATHWLTLLIGLGTIGLIVAVKQFKPTWPATLIGILAAWLVVFIFQLDQYGVIILGHLPQNLPPFALPPLTDTDLIAQLSTGAMAVAVIGLVEATSIARSITTQSGQHLDSNQEFIGQGLACITAGFFSGYPCAGSFTRSAVNYKSGAKTPLASIISSLFVLLALLVIAPYAEYIPRTALAGVLIVTAYGMVDRRAIKRILHTSLGDSSIMIATILATLFLPLQYAVLTGIITSIIRFLVKTSTPQVYPVIPAEDFRQFVKVETQPVCPQLGIISVSGPLYFGATHHVEEVIRANREQNPGQYLLLLRMHLVDHCDVSGIRMLESVVRLYRQRGGDLYLAGVRPRIREPMQAIGFDEMLGQNNFLDRHEAVSYLFHKILEPSICIYECPVRVFAECQALPKQPYVDNPKPATSLPDHYIPDWLPHELRVHLKHEKITVIDVREPAEYRKGHIPQAQLMPLRVVRQQGINLPTGQPVVVVCRIGRRSRLAANILRDMGFIEIYNLQGGTLAWEAAGYPLAIE